MNSFINRSCKSCCERQEDLLECGDGSQVICQCYDGLADEEIRQLENDEASADEVSTDSEYLMVDATTQSSADDILFCTTPKNGTSGKSMQPPPLIKRKSNDSSKLSSDNFQPLIKKQLFQGDFPTDSEFNECLKSMPYSSNIRKWREIPLNVIFRVLGVDIRGDSKNLHIANLQSEDGDIFMVWIRPRIYKQLKMHDLEEKRVYIKSLGLKPCKENPQKMYFDFSIIAKKQ